MFTTLNLFLNSVNVGVIIFAQIFNFRLLFKGFFNHWLLSGLKRLVVRHHELTNSLRLKCKSRVTDVLRLLDQGTLVQQFIADTDPLSTFLLVFVKIDLAVEISNGLLLNLDGQILLLSGISFLPKVLGKLHDVDVLHWLRTALVKAICQVLYPDEQLVSTHWVHVVNQVVAIGGVGMACQLNDRLVLLLGCCVGAHDFLCGSLFVEHVEELQGLVR